MRPVRAAFAATLLALALGAVPAAAQLPPIPPELLPPGVVLPPGYVPPTTSPTPPPTEPARPTPLYPAFGASTTSPCIAGRCSPRAFYDASDLDRPVLLEVDWNHRGAATENFTVASSTRCAAGAGEDTCQVRGPAYRSPGTFLVAMRVTDDNGMSVASTRSLRVMSLAAYKRLTSRRPSRKGSRVPGRGGGRGGGGHPLCKNLKPGEQCGAGNGRQTAGGGEKVTHKGWPAVTGVLWKVTSMGRGHRKRTGGPDNDELLGRHGHDVLNGMGGDDILWGDWDPKNNNTSQHDVLRGGPGNDWLYPSHGTTQVYGGPGKDYVWAYYGRGSIDCGPGKDTARVRLGSAFSVHNCERILHFCGHGSDGHGGCLKPGQKRRGRSAAASRRTARPRARSAR